MKMIKKLKTGKVKLFKPIKLQSTRSKVLAVSVPCVAGIVIAAVLLTGTSIALAAQSLPHIEYILNGLRGSNTFTITEVYNDENDRFFGYYVDGYEPGAGNWREVLADTETYDTFEKRKEFVDGLQDLLGPAGADVLGAGVNDAPLTWVSDYSENLPWEGTDGKTQLKLQQSQDYQLPGVMLPADEDNPAQYKGNYIFTPTPQYDEHGVPSPSATDVLLVNYLTYGGSGEYYFDLSRGLKFSGGTVFPGSEIKFDEPVYQRDEDGILIPRLDENGDIIYYDDEGNTTRTEIVQNPETGEDEEILIIVDETNGKPGHTPVGYRAYYVIDASEPDGYVYDSGLDDYISFNRAYPGHGTALYELSEDDEETDDTDESGNYIFTGNILGVEYELFRNYYVVTDYGLAAQPNGEDGIDYYGDYAAASYQGAGPAPVTDVENPVDGARFSRIVKDYTYVGAGHPDARYRYDSNVEPIDPGDPEDPGSVPVYPEVTVHCDVVYYSGGFTNNNWFLRHVFDRDSSEIGEYAGKIIVNSVRDSDLTAAMINNSDLLILATGINLSESNAVTIFNAALDAFSADSSKPIFLPVMFSRDLAESPGSAGQLVRALANKSDLQNEVASIPDLGAVSLDNGVNGNIFWTTKSVRDFLIEYPYLDPIGFEDVKQQIDDENFLRMQQGMSGSQLLDERVSNATAVRYIIGFIDKRVVHQLTEINVLEIQGGLTYNGPEGGRYSSDLTEGMIRQWIGDTDPSDYKVPVINITRMTTYEFVGKIEDLNKEYHMIYIGGTARGMNEYDEESRYNDSSMDGMVYTNIGDRYRVAPSNGHGRTLIGLVNTNDDANGWYRLSGNDLSIPKMKDIIDFAEAGYPVIIDDRLLNNAGGLSRIQVTAIDVNTAFRFRATAPDNAEYQWYRGTAPVSTDATFDLAANTTNLPGDIGTVHNFTCAITVGDETITLGPISVRLEAVTTAGAPQWPSSPCPACGNTVGNDNITPNWRGELGSWLQCQGGLAQPGYPFNNYYCGIQFNWGDGPGTMNNNANGWTAGEYEIPEDAFSPATTSTEGRINTPLATGSFASDGSASMTVNEYRVDNSSNMFETLNAIVGKPNVYSASGASNDSAYVRRYLNLSKPHINLTAYPTAYNGLTSFNATGDIFTYRFTIENETEALPHVTTYDVELYLDLNGDGRYTGYEKQNDIVVRRVSDNAIQSRNSDGRYLLMAGVEYIVTKQMPSGAVGLFDWSLRVTKNVININGNIDLNKRSIRASESGLTRIQPGEGEIKTINILQIASATINDGENFTYKNRQQRVNFEWQQRNISQQVANTSREGNTVGASVANKYLLGNDGLYYEGVYGKLIADVNDFDINIITVYADELYNLPEDIYNRKDMSTPHTGHSNNRPYAGEMAGDHSTKLPEYLYGCEIDLATLPFSTDSARTASLTQVFMAFDMLIIGFDDAYGDMPGVAAEAVLNFINNGKAVLMAHDAVSHSINPNGGQINGIEMLPHLRNAVRMDRYGVYNATYGSILRNNGYVNQAMIDSLLDRNNDYSNAYYIAYKPGSNRSETLRDIQGFGSHPLKWWNYGANGQSVRQREREAYGGNDTRDYSAEFILTGANDYNSFMGTTAGFEFQEGWGAPIGGIMRNREIPSVQTGLGRVTNTITQLNSGKITTYPYDLNRTVIDVGDTHGQWYTINMNLDDIVVWYCLSSQNYISNDAANAYYIYNSGNVTYTGAGHSMTQGNTTGRNTSERSPHPSGTGVNAHGTTWYDNNWNEWDTNPQSGNGNWQLSNGILNEAQLFVNTMIAAYRAAAEPPEVMALDLTGNNIRYQLLPSDDIVLASEVRTVDDELDVYFRLLDGNLHADKKISLSLTYAAGDEYRANPAAPFATPAEPVKPVVTDVNGTADRNGQLLSGVQYRFRLPSDVVSLLNSGSRYSAITIRLQISTENVPSSIDLVGYADIVVRRIELFNLG